MSPDSSATWTEMNQRYLMASVAAIRRRLENRAPQSASPIQSESPAETSSEQTETPPDTALSTLSRAFGLTSFERDVLLLCAGVELDSGFASLVASLQGDPSRTNPTFSLALATLGDAHWSALSPASPLRRWRMIELSPGLSLTTVPLRIDERILHYLAGIRYIDDRLTGFLKQHRAPAELTPSHERVAEEIIRLYTGTKPSARRPPLIALIGPDPEPKIDIAARSCHALNLHLCSIGAPDIPSAPAELDTLIRLWEREAFLTQSALLINFHESDPADRTRESAALRFAETAGGMILIAAPERKHFPNRRQAAIYVIIPPPAEQRALWVAALGQEAATMNGTLDHLISQFQLSPQAISASCDEAFCATSDPLESALWDACRKQARPQLEHLAQRIEAKASWDDLVLPPLQKETLRTVAMTVRLRHRVYESWGFAEKSARGLGISALFAGASGTGKTLAAEVLANELKLDLFRIDLSQIVNKYIGETEKNLKHVFDAAEAGGAILLFDEADALFGKRSEVKDSHDRYANIEVSYLLQRMESYRGLAILTTNMKDALDKAFLRRIRFIVQFPFPDAPQRADIWRRIFPDETPRAGLDAERLSLLQVAGGNIRNIALTAAFLAANGNGPVDMAHIRQAVKREYLKIEKQITAAEMAAFQDD